MDVKFVPGVFLVLHNIVFNPFLLICSKLLVPASRAFPSPLWNFYIANIWICNNNSQSCFFFCRDQSQRLFFIRRWICSFQRQHSNVSTWVGLVYFFLLSFSYNLFILWVNNIRELYKNVNYVTWSSLNMVCPFAYSLYDWFLCISLYQNFDPKATPIDWGVC